jgi:hypothetical protein
MNAIAAVQQRLSEQKVRQAHPARRWRIMRIGTLGAFCGACYSAFDNSFLLPYAFESNDMITYLSASFIVGIADGTALFVAAAVVHNYAIRFWPPRHAN